MCMVSVVCPKQSVTSVSEAF